MKFGATLIRVALAGWTVTAVLAQTPVIASFHANGRLVWTNAPNPQAIYRVEWASDPAGPWHSFTAQPLHTVDALDGTAFEVEVPIFYRVAMATNQPPQGMAWIDGGDCVLGDTFGGGEAYELPVRTNYVSGFWMDEMEVAKAKWDDVHSWAVTNGYSFENAGQAKAPNHPVHSVNWRDCVKWCNARSQREGLRPCYYSDTGRTVLYKTGDAAPSSDGAVDWAADGYRLPTEAEWERAARGGRRCRMFPWGTDTIQHARANYFSAWSGGVPVFAYDTSPTEGYHPSHNDGAMPYTSPVGSFPANGYGLHDMAGNVFEWCWDWYGAHVGAYQVDPHGPASGTCRLRCGGGWSDTAKGERCTARTNNSDLGDAWNNGGFRCVRRPP